MGEINFPNLEDISSNVRIFEGDAPNNVNTDSVFTRGTLVGLFSTITTPSNGPDYGLTSGGSLTGTAIIDVFEKTSSANEGIMRLTSLSTDTQVWNSLTSDGSLTGWSVRTILGDYYGYVYPPNPSVGLQTTYCQVILEYLNGRILLGPTGIDNSYLLHVCSGFALTGSTASVGQIFVVTKPESTGAFQTYECITPGSGTNDPATFTGPIEGAEGSYFTSYTPLTGGAECGYPYIWTWGDKLQDWTYDCGASGWIGEGSTITQVEPPPQGFQGFQGFQGRQGFQGSQGFQSWQGITGFDSPTGNDGEIQYKQGTGLSANSLAKISSNSTLDPNSGYSGNFAKYSESVRIDTSTYSSGGTINIDFDAYNVYRALNVNITISSGLLTIQGFDSHTTGQSMTLILGYEGSFSNSKIQIPSNQDIYWAGGPLDEIGEGGQTTNIKIDVTPKKYAVFNFFSDGERVYGSRSINYRKED